MCYSNEEIFYWIVTKLYRRTMVSVLGILLQRKSELCKTLLEDNFLFQVSHDTSALQCRTRF